MHLPTAKDLRERRKSLELTQSELADRADVSQPLIARIEGGDVDPRLSTLRRIVESLDEAEGDVIRAETLMHEDLVSVSPDDPVSVAVERMQDEGYSQLPVINNGIPVGSISDSDVVKAGEDAGEKSVREVMSESFPTVSTDATLEEISSLLDHYKAVMVTDDEGTQGIITEADVARHLS